MNNRSPLKREGNTEEQQDRRRLTRREREFLRHTDEIMEAAEAIFAEKGYASATMEEIAQRAEFAVGTLYRFFPSKSELYSETIMRGFRRREQEVYEALSSSDSPRERIERYLECRLSQFWENPNFFRLFFQGMERLSGTVRAGIRSDLTTRYRKLQEQLEMVFREGILRGQFRNFDEDVLRLALEGLIRNYVFQLTQQADPSRDRAKERQMLLLFLSGAGNDSQSGKGIH